MVVKKRLGSRKSSVSSSILSTRPFSQDETANVSSREARGGSKKLTMAGEASRSKDKKLRASGCFCRLTELESCLTHTIAGIFEL